MFQSSPFPDLSTIPLLCDARTRSTSAENPLGEKAGGRMEDGMGRIAARDLGSGWKVSPAVGLAAGESVDIVNVRGSGVIQHLWVTTWCGNWRKLALRAWWDDEEHPSVEVPLGDFFAMGWNEYAPVHSMPVCVNVNGGLNSYWPLPFRKAARVAIANVCGEDVRPIFYQATYSLQEIPDDAGYLHAQFRRSNPVPKRTPHTILEGVKGRGHYAGTFLAWQANHAGWWGEGEVKFFLDGDSDYPTICGTGTEDYFGGAWSFEDKPGVYTTYTTPYLGFHQSIQPKNDNQHGRRFGLYRWHLLDPIRFEEDLRVTVQALGWRSPRNGTPRYHTRQEDIASTAFWYQTEPHAPFPPLPPDEDLEVV